MRTIKAAMEKVPDGSLSTIWLKAREEFEWPDKIDRYSNMYKISVWHLPEIYSGHPKLPYYREWAARDFPRPIIHVRKRIRDIYIYRDRITAKLLKCYGLHFKIYETDPDYPSTVTTSALPGIINGDEVEFHGVIFERIGAALPGKRIGYNTDGLLRVSRVMWENCKFVNWPRGPNTNSMRYSKLNHTQKNPYNFIIDYLPNTLDGQGIRPNHPKLASNEDMRRELTVFNIGASSYNKETGTVWGISVNYDILKYSADVV